MHRFSECAQNVFLCASSLLFLTHCPNTWMSHVVSVDICSQRHSEGMQRRVCWCLGNTLNAVGPTQVWLHHLSIPWKMQSKLSENVPILEFKMNRIKYALVWADIICLALKKSKTEWCLFVCFLVCLLVCLSVSFIYLVVSLALSIAVELYLHLKPCLSGREGNLGRVLRHGGWAKGKWYLRGCQRTNLNLGCCRSDRGLP